MTVTINADVLTNLDDQKLARLIEMGAEGGGPRSKRLIVRNVGTGSDTAWALVVDSNDPFRRGIVGLVAPDEQLQADERLLFTDDALLVLWSLGFPIYLFDPVLGVKEWEAPDAATMKAQAPGAWELAVKVDRRARSLGYQ